jgi:hypothetical protein
MEVCVFLQTITSDKEAMASFLLTFYILQLALSPASEFATSALMSLQ